MKILLTIFFLFLFLSESSFSHSGGLNQQGCHNNRKTGGYHCHRPKIIPPVKKYNCKLTIGDQYYKFDPSSTKLAEKKVPLVSLTDNECSFSLFSLEIIP